MLEEQVRAQLVFGGVRLVAFAAAELKIKASIKVLN